MHLLYISILQLSYAATASRSICHTSGYVSMCVEIQNGMYSLYYTISYILLVDMGVIPQYIVYLTYSLVITKAVKLRLTCHARHWVGDNIRIWAMHN